MRPGLWLLAWGGIACLPNQGTADQSSNPVGARDDSEAADDADDAAPMDDTGTQDVLRPGVNEFSLTQLIDGQPFERRFLVHAPSGFDAAVSYPVLFAFHGLDGTGDDWVDSLAPLVNAGAFIGVYPDGHLNSWNLGQEPSTADDVAFVESILSEVVHYAGVQSERPVAMGGSNGAGMVHRLAMNTEHFVGIAAFSTALTEVELPDTSDPAVSVMQIHGTLDVVCPYAGGVSDQGHVYLPAEESAAVWAEHNGCRQGPQEAVVDAATTSLTWSECTDGVTVVHYRVTGARHGVPHDIGGDTIGLVWSFLNSAR